MVKVFSNSLGILVENQLIISHKMAEGLVMVPVIGVIGHLSYY